METARPIGLRGLMTGGALFILGAGLSSVLTIVFQLIVAHAFAATDVGRYFEMNAIVGILVGLCTGGLTLAFVLIASTLAADSASWLVHRVVSADALAACALAGTLWLIGPWVGRALFNDPVSGTLLRWGAIAIPFSAVALLLSAYARGRGQFGVHFLSQQVILPGGRLAVLLLTTAFGLSVLGAVGAYVIGAVAGAVVALSARLLNPLRRPSTPPPREMRRTVARFAAYRWGIDILQVLLLWADTVILGFFYSPSVVGTYGVGSRLVVFASAALPAMNLALSPAIARHLHAGALGSARDAYALVARWGTLLTCLPMGVVLAWRTQILGAVGSSFQGAASPMGLLAIGFIFNAACGPVGTTLDMSQRNRMVLVDNALAVGGNVALNVLLVPRWGMAGAAIAWTLSLILVNCLMFYQVARVLRISVSSRGQVVTGVGASLVLLAAWFLAMRQPWWGMLVVIGGVTLLAILGATPSEREWVRALLLHRSARPAA